MFDSFLTIQNTFEHKLKCKLFLNTFESVDDERLEWLTEVSRMDSNQLRTGLEIFPRMQDCSRYVGFNDNTKRMSCIVKPIQGNCRGGFNAKDEIDSGAKMEKLPYCKAKRNK